MRDPFAPDPFPSGPRILFIGRGDSSHTHAWIDLLATAEFNVRLFSNCPEMPPTQWNIPTYACAAAAKIPERINPTNRQVLHPLPGQIEEAEHQLQLRTLFRFAQRTTNAFNRIGTRLGLPELQYAVRRHCEQHARRTYRIQSGNPGRWLARVINDWKPDIIHTLGLFDAQGGEFYAEVREQFGLHHQGKWVLQLRGGSDIALRKHDPEIAQRIHELLSACDQVITDNHFNIEYIRSLGLADRVASIAPVPGTGGIRVPSAPSRVVPPSKRERILYWPKAYECAWSKSLPVVEAIRIAWDQIKPCTVKLTAASEETRRWIATLPAEIQAGCHIQNRVPHEQALSLMQEARVMLAPSLVDGVPNVLYEAMAHGAFPILSPLATITPVVEENSNVLFARNLYPAEIAHALVRAMGDDALVDAAARNNLELVSRIADRDAIALGLREYYLRLLHTTQH